ncbi:hypothetical protein SCLCIDRAFT_112336, partial [Scleroderma citrinum Foug A]
LVQMMKKWNSPVYAFFEPVPTVVEVGGHCAHVFMCCGCGCKVTVQHNMWKHVKICWGEDALGTADKAKDVNEAWTKIVHGILQDGSITTAFERKDKRNAMYSSRPYTHSEIRAKLVHWVSESLCPYSIVKDRGFKSLMKTGRLECYIPSPLTISHDVKLVFAQT